MPMTFPLPNCFAASLPGRRVRSVSYTHLQAVELRKKKSGSLAHRAHRIFGMLLLPGGKIFLRAGKIQVVKSGESLFQSRTRY